MRNPVTFVKNARFMFVGNVRQHFYVFAAKSKGVN